METQINKQLINDRIALLEKELEDISSLVPRIPSPVFSKKDMMQLSVYSNKTALGKAKTIVREGKFESMSHLIDVLLQSFIDEYEKNNGAVNMISDHVRFSRGRKANKLHTAVNQVRKQIALLKELNK